MPEIQFGPVLYQPRCSGGTTTIRWEYGVAFYRPEHPLVEVRIEDNDAPVATTPREGSQNA